MIGNIVSWDAIRRAQKIRHNVHLLKNGMAVFIRPSLIFCKGTYFSRNPADKTIQVDHQRRSIPL